MGTGASKGKEPPACSHPCCWSELPLDLAGIVLLRLDTHADHVRFGSVCRHWRHAAKLLHSPSSPPPAPLPWLNFRDGTFERLADGKCHRVRLEAYDGLRAVPRPLRQLAAAGGRESLARRPLPEEP